MSRQVRRFGDQYQVPKSPFSQSFPLPLDTIPLSDDFPDGVDYASVCSSHFEILVAHLESPHVMESAFLCDE